MRLEWRTVVKDDKLWGWRLFDFDFESLYIRYHHKATVRQLLCKTKREFKVWMFGVEVGRYRRMFYTEEEAKAWVVAIVRM